MCVLIKIERVLMSFVSQGILIYDCKIASHLLADYEYVNFKKTTVEVRPALCP